MREKIAFENGRISNFQGLMTLDRVILHTVMHHSSTSTYITNYVEIEQLFVDKWHETDPNRNKVNQHAKYLGATSFESYCVHRDTHNLIKSITWTTKVISRNRLSSWSVYRWKIYNATIQVQHLKTNYPHMPIGKVWIYRLLFVRYRFLRRG